MRTSLYSFTSITCLFVLLVILHKVISKKMHDPVTKAFLVLIVSSILFCFNDNFFGFFFVNINENNRFLVQLTTFLYYYLGSLTAYLWVIFMSIYSDEKLENHKIFASIAVLPHLFVIGLLISNFSNHWIFSVNETNHYVKGPYKSVIYYLNLIYFVFASIKGGISYLKSTDKELKYKYLHIFTFSILPTVSLFLQIFRTGAPFYTIGIMLSCLIIFSYISTSQFEIVMVKRHEIENLKRIVENEKVIFSIADTYLSMHDFYLNENRYVPFKSTPFIDAFLENPNDAQKDINKAMTSLTTPQYTQKILDFIKISTVSERLGKDNEISVEFLGNHSGWCVASWIRVQNNDKDECIQAIFAVRRIDEEKRREIEYERKFKQAIMNENEIFGEILQNQSTGTVVINSNDKIVTINTSASKYLNLPKDVLDNCSLNTLLSYFKTSNSNKIIQKLNTIKVNGGFYTFEFQSESEDKTVSHYRADAKQLKLSNGEKVLIISITDITTNKAMERELLILSETDSLTGINNRGSGEQKTAELLRNGKTGMLCLLDADKFKSINDTFGHHVGDKVIIEIANALKKSFRDRDIIMRLGGDEFAMFAVGCVDKNAGDKCMERFFSHIDNIRIPELDGRKVSVSVGCVLCNKLEKFSFDDYYQMADSAMYFSKTIPGNSYTFHRL